MNSLREEKSLAYISSIQINPKTLNPMPIQTQPQQPNYRFDLNDQLTTSALMFSNKDSKRTISCTASGEFSLPPDKCKLTLIIKSLKSNIDEAKHSVGRRLDYIQQTLKNNSIKVSISSVKAVYELIFIII